jgi:uncharacterized repeat protein (TIGR03803 family)
MKALATLGEEKRMKLEHRHSFCALMLLLTAASWPAPVYAATPIVTTLHQFQNSDGANPYGELVQASDGLLYGTTRAGGDNGLGTVYVVTAAGVSTTLYSFRGTLDGQYPEGPLVEAPDGYLYGTASQGGLRRGGTVFRITKSGTLRAIAQLARSTGTQPHSGLVLRGALLYGTTSRGGVANLGTVFSIARTGALTVLHDFRGADGAQPHGELIGSGGLLYGTTSSGGAAGAGTIYAIAPNGAFTSLYSFTGGADGGTPDARLVLGSSGSLFGTASRGGTSNANCPGGCGTVFRFDAPGAITVLHRFAFFDGRQPESGLTEATDGMLLGTTYQGGDGCFFLELSLGCGVGYRIAQSGSNFEKFYDFDYGDTFPQAGFALADSGLMYGAAIYDGLRGSDAGDGALLRVDPTPTTIVSFAPPSGPVGTPVTLTGSNFTPVTAVAFNGIAATFTIDTPTQITTTVPAGASSGPITVTAPNGVAASSNFEVTIAGLTLTRLHTFLFGPDGTNSPIDKLIEGADGALYSTALGSGSEAGGIYRITTGGAFTMLQNFTLFSPTQFPWGGLVLGSDGNFYGTSEYGGSAGNVFRLTPANGFNVAANFNGTTQGSTPRHDGLIQANDGAYYATAESGGFVAPGLCQFGCGTVFKFVPGVGLSALHAFVGTDGRAPDAGVIQASDGNLYGTANSGGAGGRGVVYRVSLAGAYSVLHAFANGEGGFPKGRVVEASDGNFYGTTPAGGANNMGVVYRVTPAGAYTTLHSFAGLDGSAPQAALIAGPDGALYGTTAEGGAFFLGTIFRITLDGQFQTYFSFHGDDGAHPYAALMRASDGALYGTTRQGGGFGCTPGFVECGTVFRLTLP